MDEDIVDANFGAIATRFDKIETFLAEHARIVHAQLEALRDARRGDTELMRIIAERLGSQVPSNLPPPQSGSTPQGHSGLLSRESFNFLDFFK